MRIALLLALSLLIGCPTATPAPDRSGPLSFQVTFVNDPGGSDAASPLPFDTDGTTHRIAVEAIGYDRQVMTDFTANVALKVTPAQLLSAPFVLVENGRAEADITFSRGLGQVRVWASDEGTDETPGSYATGVSPVVHYELPTVREVQETTATTTSPMEKMYVHMRGWDPEHEDSRDLRVTAVTNDGFYVTDLSDPPGSYNSLFAFSFSRPDGIELGMRLERLSGKIEEFLGFTELAFPDWVVAEANEVPEIEILDPTIVCNSPAMEAWESSVVTVIGLESDFGGIGDCEDYNEYGQWPAKLLDPKMLDPVQCSGSDARINVVNINTVPSYTFDECADFGRPDDRFISSLTGILRHNEFASPSWILEVRDCMDFPPELRPADCEAQLRLPLSGPRKAPQFLYRDIPECEGHLTSRGDPDARNHPRAGGRGTTDEDHPIPDPPDRPRPAAPAGLQLRPRPHRR